METNPNVSSSGDDLDRRQFLSTLSAAVSSGVLFSRMPDTGSDFTQKVWTVGEVIDLFIRQIPGTPFTNTVDTLKAGNREIRITGIVTTMFATIAVIEKAIAADANFIIAHEPTYYNHLDDTTWLGSDDVYRYKSGLLEKHRIAVWRNHDYIHSLQPDGVTRGVLKKLGWEKFSSREANLLTMPGTTVQALIRQLKEALGISHVRYVGDISQSCKKVLFMPGAAGGRSQITAIMKEKPDVLICGEVSEWETAEYVRDARAAGEQLSLIVLGHIASEEPGSEFLASWMKENVKGVPVTHIPAGNSLVVG